MKSLTTSSPLNLQSDKSDCFEKFAAKSNRKKELPFDQFEIYRSYWCEEKFMLDRCGVYRKLEIESKESVLAEISCSIIEELYFIETAGMNFSTKMSLLADSIEEKQMYCFFASHEAQHFRWLTDHCPYKPESLEVNPFLQFISRIINTGSKNQLKFFVQVLLEGWGIDYYQDLMRRCNSASLKSVFKTILRDEADHHFSGVKSFDERELTRAERVELISNLRELLSMIQIGPLAMMGRLEQAHGYLTYNELLKLLSELENQTETNAKLNRLKKLMLSAGAEKIVSTLEGYKCFTAFSDSDSINAYRSA